MLTIEQGRRHDAIGDIFNERQRQVRLKAEGRFKHTPADDEMSDGERLATIIEEVGEVGRNVLCRAGLVTDGDPSDSALRTELAQIAALCVAWMERL